MALMIQKKTKPTQHHPAHVNGKNQEPLSIVRATQNAGSQAGRRVSEEEYWARYYRDPDYRYEWNNGILEEKPVAKVRSSKQYQWFNKLVDAWLHANPEATIVNLEIGFRLALAKKTTIRRPDLFIVRHDNPVPLRDDDRTFAGICDLCVESVSDSDQDEIDRDTVTKKAEYGEIGVREYYILDSERTNTIFYRQSPQGGYELLPIGSDGIVRSQVLPGFQFRVEDLYHQPDLIELVDDEVYRHYVHLEYQLEKARADAEHLRAEAERKRAETEMLARKKAESQAEAERLRAETERFARSQVEAQLANALAQLRALGIEP